MCSVLIFTRPENMALNLPRPWLRPQVGDVVDIHDDDGHHWGGDIQGPNALGWWRVVVIEGVKRVKVSGLLSADQVPDHPDVPYRQRINTLDVSRLRDRMSRKEMLSCMTQKPAPANPFTIGDDPKVIG